MESNDNRAADCLVKISFQLQTALQIAALQTVENVWVNWRHTGVHCKLEVVAEHKSRNTEVTPANRRA